MKEGRRIRTLDPINVLIPYIMPTRTGASNSFSMTLADSALPHRVDVGRADGDRQWTADRVHGAARRTFLLDPADLADAEHCKTFHVYSPSCVNFRDNRKLSLFFDLFQNVFYGCSLP